MILSTPIQNTNMFPLPTESPYEAIERNIKEHGFFIKEPLIIDDNIHRFDIEKSGNKRGWYVLHSIVFENGERAIIGAVGDFKSSIPYVKVCSHSKRSIDPIEWAKEEALINARIEEIKKEKREKAETVSKNLTESIEKLPQADSGNPYLVAKKIGEFSNLFKEKNKTLIIPLYNICYTKVKTAQLINISENNTFKKTYVIGGEASGSYFIFGRDKKEYNICYICEGVATGASIFRATNRMVVCSMSANNLKRAVEDVRNEYKGIYVVVVADNDESRTGIIKAEESKADRVVLIPLMLGWKNMDANDYETNGGDLKRLLEENIRTVRTETKIESDDEIISNMKPTEWWIKNWVPKESLVMIHGESGGGKTFILRDMMLCVATGKEWHGQRVKKGKVLYLCGEGLQTVKERTLAWKLSNGVESLGEDSYTLPLTTDFDTQNGLLEVVNQIENAKIRPDLIAIDTVNRYMEGDENSAEQVRSFINNCSFLTEKYNATVVLVHHTGHSQNAKDRARGSSAWRGALDTEISVHQSDHIITAKQTKQKGIELQGSKEFMLSSFALPLKDDDGEQLKSAILIEYNGAESEPTRSHKNEQNGRKKTIEKDELKHLVDGAFLKYGTEMYGASVMRKDLIQYLIENGYNSNSVRAWCTPNGQKELDFSGIATYMKIGDCYAIE